VVQSFVSSGKVIGVRSLGGEEDEALVLGTSPFGILGTKLDLNGLVVAFEGVLLWLSVGEAEGDNSKISKAAVEGDALLSEADLFSSLEGVELDVMGIEVLGVLVSHKNVRSDGVVGTSRDILAKKEGLSLVGSIQGLFGGEACPN